jgi:hypothetical protein
MHKSATKCNETLSKWCKNKHGASKIMDTFETYQTRGEVGAQGGGAVLHHGGVIGRINKVYADPNHEYCLEVRWW